jgi:hypothetical protein
LREAPWFELHASGLGAVGFVSGLQPLLDALARRGGQGRWQTGLLVFIVFLRGGTQKSNVPAVPTAPLAEEQMNSQTQALAERERAIERIGLQTYRFPAIERNITHAFCQRLQFAQEQLH